MNIYSKNIQQLPIVKTGSYDVLHKNSQNIIRTHKLLFNTSITSLTSMMEFMC